MALNTEFSLDPATPDKAGEVIDAAVAQVFHGYGDSSAENVIKLIHATIAVVLHTGNRLREQAHDNRISAEDYATLMLKLQLVLVSECCYKVMSQVAGREVASE